VDCGNSQPNKSSVVVVGDKLTLWHFKPNAISVAKAIAVCHQ
jgi:hypothetical protein